MKNNSCLLFSCQAFAGARKAVMHGKSGVLKSRFMGESLATRIQMDESTRTYRRTYERNYCKF